MLFYLGSITEVVFLKCISIPVTLDYGELTLLDHIRFGSHQEFKGFLLNSENQQSTLDNISAILRNRDCESDLEKWNELFYRFPDTPHFNLGLRYTNLFYQLSSGHGGPIQVSVKIIVIYHLNYTYFNRFLSCTRKLAV